MEGDFTSSTGDIFGRKRKRGAFHNKAKDKEAKLDDGLSKEPGKKRAKGNNFDGPKSAQYGRGGNGGHRNEGSGQKNNEAGPGSTVVSSEVLRGVNVADFTESRALEVANAMKALKEAAQLEGQRVLQRLPRHMRRRAASYDTRRIPRSQRMAAAREDAANPIKKSKMPSRKHRRRPKNLLEEYNRRKKKHAWLETHIWHAKRFKMTEYWGYKMAEQPCDKGFRAAYRASAHGCIMQDISYQSCIEVNGPEREIIDVFAHLTCKKTGSSITSRDILSGKRSCSLVLYEHDFYPYKAVASVDIIWKPLLPVFDEKQEMKDNNGLSSNLHRALWIWCHPACHDNVLEVIKDSFARTQLGSKREGIIETQNDNVITGQNNEAKPIDKGSAEKEQLGSERLGMCSENFHVNERISVSSMKLDFVKIRLTGPTSHKVLVDALQLHDLMDSNSVSWWQRYYDHSNKELLAETNKAWGIMSNLASQAELPSRAVFGLTVIDPRMNIPIKKTWPGKQTKDTELSTVEGKEKIELLVNWSEMLCHSPIWNEEIRKEVKRTKITESELNKKRSEKFDAGEHLEIGDETSRIPVLLIQRPGVLESDVSLTMSNYGSGWDFIAPSGWGMAFWVSFVYRGAHVGGQREERNISLEGKSLYFPKEYPDTKAGKKFLEEQKVQNEEVYKRFPASKRPNHQKLGIVNPFGADWKALCEEWNDIFGDLVKESKAVSAEENDPKLIDSSKEFSERAVVSEGVDSIEKANICDSPTQKEFYVLRNVRLLRDIQECFMKCRPIRSKKDKNKDPSKLDSVESKQKLQQQQELSNMLLREHGNALIAVSFLCINKGEATDNAVMSIPSQDDLTKLSTDPKYPGPLEPMHKGLKELFQTVADSLKVKKSRVTSIGSCTRWTIGHVTSGRYSYTNGKGSGVGFVFVKGLLACFDGQKTLGQGCIVLLRNTNSQQYRFARINVVL